MRILIVGGEAAGMSAAAKAWRLIKDGEIVVYEASEIISFGYYGLPYFVGDEFHNPEYMAEFTPAELSLEGIVVKTRHQVIRSIHKRRRFGLRMMKCFRRSLRQLVIATGGEKLPSLFPGLSGRGFSVCGAWRMVMCSRLPCRMRRISVRR